RCPAPPKVFACFHRTCCPAFLAERLSRLAPFAYLCAHHHAFHPGVQDRLSELPPIPQLECGNLSATRVAVKRIAGDPQVGGRLPDFHPFSLFSLRCGHALAQTAHSHSAERTSPRFQFTPEGCTPSAVMALACLSVKRTNSSVVLRILVFVGGLYAQ